MVSKQKDLKNVARREKTFSTLAHKEGLGARQRAKKENKENMPASAKDSSREAKWDEEWSKMRDKIAKAAKARAK
jgi:hypothetical protein